MVKITLAEVKSAINAAKNKLLICVQRKRRHNRFENFGRTEIRKLEYRYGNCSPVYFVSQKDYLQAMQEINNFKIWCYTFDFSKF